MNVQYDLIDRLNGFDCALRDLFNVELAQIRLA